MRRREVIAVLGGAAVCSGALWPRAARAQQGGRVLRVGVLMYGSADDPDMKARLFGFTRSLTELGWSDGRNLRMDIRWSIADVELVRAQARELLALNPDVVVATSTITTAAFQRETQKIPVVFVGISDPVGSGFINIERKIGGKWLQLLKEIAPGIKRVALMYSPETATGAYYMPSLEVAAQSLDVTPIAAPVRTDHDIEAAIDLLGREPGGGLILPPDGFITTNRSLILTLALRSKIPSVSADEALARDGGLLSYGPDRVDIYARAATYVDRILRGAKPLELPIQLPIKFEMVINQKNAKALGLSVPASILLRADEVIE
jgi:putative tryptophan/tyrosine transport system substrate-binding protein